LENVAGRRAQAPNGSAHDATGLDKICHTSRKADTIRHAPNVASDAMSRALFHRERVPEGRVRGGCGRLWAEDRRLERLLRWAFGTLLLACSLSNDPQSGPLPEGEGDSWAPARSVWTAILGQLKPRNTEHHAMSERNLELSIRDATLDDLEIVAEFNQRLARETESRTLDPATLSQGVARALGDRNLCRYFVAEVDGRVVGQTMVTYEWSDWRCGVFWWFQSVYVEGGFRGRGIFRALYEHVAQLARNTPDVCGLRLYVERENGPAIATYGRLGMAPTGHLVCEHDWSGAVRPV